MKEDKCQAHKKSAYVHGLFSPGRTKQASTGKSSSAVFSFISSFELLVIYMPDLRIWPRQGTLIAQHEIRMKYNTARHDISKVMAPNAIAAS